MADPERNAGRPTDRPTDRAVGGDEPAPDVPAEKEPLAGTPLLRRDESEPYGIDREGTNVVHSDTVGAAELSAEYTAGRAADDTATDVDEAAEAWDEARDDYDGERPSGR